MTAEQIKKATAHFTNTNEREVRVLCKQDARESRPQVFVDNNLFILPIKNGAYLLWEFGFAEENNYNSIELLKSAKFTIQNNS